MDRDERLEYLVKSMSCGSCRSLVMEELLDLDGVADVDVDLGSKQVTVYGSALSDVEIRARLSEVGHAPA